MAEPPLAFNILTKPIGPICNLDCSYCFYLHKEELFPEGKGEPSTSKPSLVRRSISTA